MKTQFGNLIGGKEITLSGKYFNVASPFYSDSTISVADSSQMDIALAISKVKKANCKNLSFEKRLDILKKSAKKIKFTKQEIIHTVKMTGMPIKYIEDYLNEIPKIMCELPEIIGKKYQILDGKISATLYEKNDFHKIEFREALPGFVYAVTPGNDPRITALVSTILVSVGLPGIIKPSKTDALVSHKIINLLIDAGYPQDALNIIFFDSSDAKTTERNFKLCDTATVIWPFGEDKSVDKILRFEHKQIINFEKFAAEKNIMNPKQQINMIIDELKKETNVNKYIEDLTIDHFASKTILRHASGRCAGILDEDFDLKTATELIMSSSMNYPIGCNSMKALFATKGSYDKILESLKKEFEELDKKTGDPLKSKTRVGYIDPKLINYMLKKVDELKRVGLINIVTGGIKISDIQVTPILATTNDVHSEILLNETSAYILGLKNCDSFENCVKEVNEAAGENKKLAVAIYSNNKEHMKSKIHAHHVKINYLTTNIDGIIHEGNDYIAQLTKPYVIHVHKKHTIEHPYRGGN